MGTWLSQIVLNNQLINLLIPKIQLDNPLTTNSYLIESYQVSQMGDNVLGESVISDTLTKFYFRDGNYLEFKWDNPVVAVNYYNGYQYKMYVNDTIFLTSSGSFFHREPVGFSVYIDNELEQAAIFIFNKSDTWDMYSIGHNFSAYSTAAKRETIYQVVMNSLPIVYNYIPINYIFSKDKALKLSMIKAESTNHGESVSEGSLTDIQRFTDSTDLYAFGSDLAVDEEKVLGYTSQNNYVTFKRTYNSDPTWVSGELHYYENGVELTGLKQTNLPSMHDEGSTYSKVYFSLLLDSEHSACRPSIIWVYKATQGSDVDYVYNSFENNASIITDANQSLWFTWLASGYHTDTTDPYDYGGDSTPDSGDGQWDNSSENIDIPSIPTVSISDTGFVSVFNPTLSQVKALADYMWAGAFDVSLFKKVMANPMDSIIGFALIPCEPTVSGVDTVKVGNIDTGVSMNAVSNQFVDVDCGTLDLNEYWGNYLDYAPYTKITLVLPFIGSVHLSPDDCMKKKIGIKYRIDILSGGCVAYVTCNDSVLYQFTGSCSAQLPITNLDYRGMISALISIGTTAVGVGSAIASGGITAPMVAVGVGNTANNVMNGKPNIQHGGSLGSTSGFLGTRVPYLIITRPRQCVPTGVNKFKGLPSLITSKLKNVTGFTQVHDIHLDNVPCSDAEKTELRSILESGVIV